MDAAPTPPETVLFFPVASPCAAPDLCKNKELIDLMILS